MSDQPPPGNAPLPEEERTVVRPRPGSRPAPAGAGAPPGVAAGPPASAAAMPAQESWPGPSSQPRRSESGTPQGGQAPSFEAPPGTNPILRHAYKLLAVGTQIRQLAQHPNPSGLKEQLTTGIREFEGQIRREGVANEKVIAARYILCTTLDECAALTPWGSVGVWAKDTLLVRFHNETWGGEKVFMLLSKLAENPGANLDLLELIYACLALGFEGRYRIVDNGRSQLETVRERLYQIIRSQHPEQDRRLSPTWSPATLMKRSWLDAAPFWAVAGLALMVVVIGYAVYSYLLANRSDPVFADISGLRLANVRPAAPAAPAAKPKFNGLLQEEVAAGLVSISEVPGRSTITLKGDGFFDPGKAELQDKALAPLKKIADALSGTKGSILVAGHTDSQPIRTARFPSNYELSVARASTVQQLLGKTMDPARLRAEGRAASEPLASNDTPADRARNRRVDIILFTQD